MLQLRVGGVGPGLTYPQRHKELLHNFGMGASLPQPELRVLAELGCKQRSLHGNRRRVTGTKGAGSAAKRLFPQKALRRREFCVFPQRRGHRDVAWERSGQILGHLNLPRRRGTPSWESGDLRLALVLLRAGPSRAALLSLGLGLPRCTVMLGCTFRPSQPQAVPGPLSHKPGPAWS